MSTGGFGSGGGIASERIESFSYTPARRLRPNAKVLPEHARGHNRALVLQTLFASGAMSRADIARATGLTRVSISDLVASLIADNLIVEVGLRETSRPGKPATLIDINRDEFQIVGLDLSDTEVFRGAVLTLDGEVVTMLEVPLDGATGADAIAKAVALAADLVEEATVEVLGIGVGSPGVVDMTGTVRSAPNLGWTDVDLQGAIEQVAQVPVLVANDANAAVLAEYSFGGADGDLMLVSVGNGVGAGLLVGGHPLFGSRFAAGEIGHVVVGTDGGPLCACGKRGCLEAWLAVPHLRELLAAAAASDLPAAEVEQRREEILRAAGERLGVSLAAIVGALNLSEIVVSGPEELLDGVLLDAAIETVRARTMTEFHGGVQIRMSEQGADIVLRGTAVMVLSGLLGVS
ncbi:ROK family transcriptional regulator [Plantibacter sp. CFBP 8798]|uniref:ROK family transcriptional regulator n=1 Tax=Plantibacter sp. CFBP 8798 TaxID=2775268 RepID=UPI00177EE459|nr:ROK family transcriptional regulator [Plantibacter sp. CFBP 8798]MBD8467047.1 ROK family transcriptional regulator [Plantibacter sp. CFBP 8798]